MQSIGWRGTVGAELFDSFLRETIVSLFGIGSASADSWLPRSRMRAMASKKGHLILLAVILAALGEAQGERLPIKSYGTPDGLGSSFIEFILQDSHRYLWVCTRDGLSRFDGYIFKTYRTSDGLPVPNVSSIVENADGTFWVTTNGGGVCKFDPAGKVASESKNGSLFATYSLGNSDFSNRANIVYKQGEPRLGRY